MSGAVGVITRTKNRNVFLERAIESVLNQTYSNWQLFIVNDGGCTAGVDASVAKFASRLGSRVTVIHNHTSVGMEAAANIGLRHADTDYALIHDDDDTIEPRFLEVTVGFLESAEGCRYKGVATKVNRIVEKVAGDRIIVERSELYRPEIESIQLSAMASRNQLNTIAFVYHRSVHDEVGYYDESLPVLGDWEFNLRFLTRYDIHQLPDALANYHFRQANAGDHSNSVIAGASRVQRYRAIIKNRLLRADLERGTFGVGAMLSVAGPSGSERSAIAYSKEFILKQLKRNAVQDVVLYGTGGYASELYDEFAKHRIRVACVVDSNRKLSESGFTFKGHPIRTLSDAMKEGHHTYVAGSFSFADDLVVAIQNEAKSQGVTVNICAP